MRFALTDDQQAFAAAVHDLMVRTCPPTAVRAAWERASALDLDRWSRLADMGVLGLAGPQSPGGPAKGAASLGAGPEQAGGAPPRDGHSPLYSQMRVGQGGRLGPAGGSG